MELTGTGLCGSPWPELLPDRRPVLVVPAMAGPAVPAGEGWTAHPPGYDPTPGWTAVLDGQHLTVRRPGGQPWYKGPVAAGRQWQRAIRTHRTLLLVTGPFTGVLDFRAAAATGELLLLTVAARLTETP
ncbi:hypothetical protein [Kitasatospora purpeofusca]|uniref:hypothetical protein n=1 Tax=Kitasatospora purpeofusca TaxID=67352 RepID=UPI0022597FA2|nr:hypothetical protein [Kitasatospora purpeofusca]MCX4755166.1 hypothetical protein [Kitasatospora purpeofusca]WSR36945.1 hypothetical protein OG715_41865 [Kitasatospora purpeofusca]WSR45228.1 hypothetical protein OG196_42745 [Kitasatospora purpeofusca]